jgi:hypothetical protein
VIYTLSRLGLRLFTPRSTLTHACRDTLIDAGILQIYIARYLSNPPFTSDTSISSSLQPRHLSPSCHLSCHIHYTYIHQTASFPAAPGRLAPDMHALALNFPVFSHGNTRRRQARKQLDAPRGLETCSCARAPGEQTWRGCNHRIHPPSRLDACDTVAAISPRLWCYCRIESRELLLLLLRGMQGYGKAYSLLVCLLFQLPQLVQTHARAILSQLFPSWSLHRFGNIRRLVLRWLLRW